jgi:hypothetical protein
MQCTHACHERTSLSKLTWGYHANH